MPPLIAAVIMSAMNEEPKCPACHRPLWIDASPTPTGTLFTASCELGECPLMEQGFGDTATEAADNLNEKYDRMIQAKEDATANQAKDDDDLDD